MEDNKYLIISFMGEYLINHNLCMKQGIDDEQLEVIKELHLQKDSYLFCMKCLDPETSQSSLKYLASRVQDLEYALQKAWGFPQDHRYHKWWNVPHCQCPKMDNEDAVGAEYKIVNGACRIHGEIKDK